ncbi:type II toxin-antitoxin system VapC family toxin [Rhodopila globiformis]|uniref:PIN domain nuclease n=1 Tax=Rhodopila globiformis TaxID=1071 RepID=A0A2S6MWV8_RHOGL|nr:type II toxin-antitoxin system VapC family toxin [Rhodopila globiformis]PPQ26854.1 PIN domain nuclease [Rhodopila globiformis]
MTDTLLLDTHILLWLDSGSDRLRPTTRERIDACWRGGGTILVSAVSVWEIAVLVDAGRIGLDLPVAAWIERFATRPGIDIVPLGYPAAAQAYQLHDLAHRDPGDRLLIATAIERCCPLVTYDARIAAFAGTFGGQYGFAAVA